jgi:adenylate cyclase
METKIKKALEDEELKSEKIASITQLFIIVVLFILYQLSPKGFANPETTFFEPVKLLFFIYIPVLCIRALHIWLSGKISFLHYAYLGFDIIAITGLIFSFHVQYNQPFSISLRAPTFLYYFIFISMRCVSYDYFKVIFVGLACVLCWTGMTIYGLQFADLIRTSSFARILEPNTIILGVEIDKIIALLAVTIICASTVYRKRKLLEEFSLKSARGIAMERLIGKETFQSMSENGQEMTPGKGVKRTAATMMIDLRGFSKLSYELQAEELIEYLGQYHRIAATSVFKFGGSIDKYLGDGILAHFGAVTENINFASNALLAAEDIHRELVLWINTVAQNDGPKFDFGIAVAMGEIIFGAIGHTDRMEITVIGESVNLSAKLEKHTKTIGYRIVTTMTLFDAAVANGYAPGINATHIPNQEIAGIPHTINLVGLGEHR